MSGQRYDYDGEPALRMSRSEWTEVHPGRYERLNGVVVAMAPERVACPDYREWEAVAAAKVPRLRRMF